MVHGALGKHSEVLDLGLAERRAVVGDENHLGAGAAHRLYGRLVPQRSLSGLHHQLEPGVHRLDGLLLVSRESTRADRIGTTKKSVSIFSTWDKIITGTCETSAWGSPLLMDVNVY